MPVSHLSPPQAARQRGISVNKVHEWIASGELRAVNMATKPGGRPRWKIDVADLEAFEERRANTPAPKPSRRRRKTDVAVKDFV
ncbi:MAG: helix-turn-helix domain-containing protein [Planctomycetota bacterium]